MWLSNVQRTSEEEKPGRWAENKEGCGPGSPVKKVLQGDGNKVCQALLSKKRLSIDYWLEQWGFIFDNNSLARVILLEQ